MPDASLEMSRIVLQSAAEIAFGPLQLAAARAHLRALAVRLEKRFGARLQQRRSKTFVKKTAVKQHVGVRGKELPRPGKMRHGFGVRSQPQQIAARLAIPGAHLWMRCGGWRNGLEQRTAEHPVHARVAHALPSSVGNRVHHDLARRSLNDLVRNELRDIGVQGSAAQQHPVCRLDVGFRERSRLPPRRGDGGFEVVAGPGGEIDPGLTDLSRLVRPGRAQPFLEPVAAGLGGGSRAKIRRNRQNHRNSGDPRKASQ